MYACSGITCHLHFWQNDRGLLCATAITQGWNRHQIRASTESDVNSGEENSPTAPPRTRACNLLITNPGLYQQDIPAPYHYYQSPLETEQVFMRSLSPLILKAWTKVLMRSSSWRPEQRSWDHHPEGLNKGLDEIIILKAWTKVLMRSSSSRSEQRSLWDHHPEGLNKGLDEIIVLKALTKVLMKSSSWRPEQRS